MCMYEVAGELGEEGGGRGMYVSHVRSAQQPG